MKRHGSFVVNLLFPYFEPMKCSNGNWTIFVKEMSTSTMIKVQSNMNMVFELLYQYFITSYILTGSVQQWLSLSALRTQR